MEQNSTTKYWESEYWHPAVTVDAVVFGYDNKDGLSVLLIERGGEPFKGWWALPGGFITQEDESAEAAVRRELFEESNVQGVYLKEFMAFSKKNRDPRERVISIAFYALVVKNQYVIKGGDDAKKAQWFPINNLPQLPFDHQDIIDTAYEQLKRDSIYEPIIFRLLGNEFTIKQLSNTYRKVLNILPTSYESNDNFLKLMRKMHYIKETGNKVTGTSYRPPKLYTLDEEGFYEERDRKIKMNL